jgi:SNF2 family DNA or RNA helicase
LHAQSPPMKGILAKNKDVELFPASPTLIDIMLHYLPKERQAYNNARKTLIERKNNNSTIYDERLRPYQNADVHFLSALTHGKGVFNEQRTGKTPTTLVTMKILKQHKNLILVPSSAVSKWKQEYEKWHGGIAVTHRFWHNKKRREKSYKANPNTTFIINFHKATADLELILKYLGPFDAIVLDEAHIMRNYVGETFKINKRTNKPKYHSPAITRNIMRLRRQSKDAYALTGTPTPNKQHNIYGIVVFLFPKLFENYNRVIDYYFNRYIDRYNYNSNVFYTIKGFKNRVKEKEFLEFLETFSVQRKRKEIMQWLPKVDSEIIYLDRPANIEKWHFELQEYFETEHIVCQTKLTVMLRQRQLTSNPKVLKLDDVGPKFKWIKDLIKDYPKRPIIIVSFFRTILENLFVYLNQENVRIISGNTNEDQRRKLELEFQDGAYDILLGNVEVIATYFTLSRAQQIIVLDPSLTYSTNTQMYDRFLPTTKEEAEDKELQLVTKLIIPGTIDEYLLKALDEKKSKTDIINNYIEHLNKKQR